MLAAAANRTILDEHMCVFVRNITCRVYCTQFYTMQHNERVYNSFIEVVAVSLLLSSLFSPHFHSHFTHSSFIARDAEKKFH